MKTAGKIKKKAGVVAYRSVEGKEPLVLVVTSRKVKGSWVLPVGTVEKGESLDKAAQRECAEESGYSVQTGLRLQPIDITDGEGTVQFTFFLATVVGEVPHWETDRKRNWLPVSMLCEVLPDVFHGVAKEAERQLSRSRLVRQENIHGRTMFPIVGIGASAGGLEAFEAFFEKMPADSGIGFVLVAHLDPDHVSILPEIIQRKTALKVLQAQDNQKVEPDTVYIIPPNKEISILDGTLQLLDMVLPRGHNLPIDTFFRSLAQDQGSNAICIVLSGTGTDGTLGLLAVKGESGLAMAQELASARYDSMPRNAIRTGRVDFVLSPDKMPEQLLRYVSHTKTNQFSKINIVDKSMNNSLQKIFVLLRAHTGHDFSLYKKNTLCRRIERRMHIHQIDNVSDYVRYLQESSREVSVLFKELLIGVTHFFRDSDAFNQLQNTFLPDLMKDKPDDYTIRIWVPGCSSGEEPYSIAIVVKECMVRLGRHFNVQIFATDIDETAINEARLGVYPESIAADVNAERLEKYFIKEENHFHLKKTIREMVIFAQQNIIKDPPFTKLDMLCCRNLLIYFNQELQKKLLPIFHYSLKAEGLLFLGSSETIGQYTELFIALDKKCKIFKRTSSETVGYPVLYFPPQRGSVVMQEKKVPGSVKNVKGINTFKLLQSILSQSDIPACVVIDDQANIIYIHGKTGRFFEPAQGEVSVNIVEMARNGLKAGLKGAIRKLVTHRQETVVSGLQVKDNGGYISVNLIVRPLPHFETGQRGLVLVIFEEVVTAHNKVQQKTLSTSGRHAKIDEVRRLEDELQYTRENLQTTIEELETSNEELRSTNEELQSTNEELQSTNEELETSKEELQSLNEESTTVNAELQSRIDELVKANDDIKNLLDAIEIATIFLDNNLGVRRFTPKANELFPLTIIDIGRPIMHFASSLQGIDLQQHAQKVLDDLTMQEMEVDDKQGKIFRMRIRPYRTVNNFIDGVVITFEDITKIKKIEAEILKLSSGFEEKLLMMSKVFTDGVDPIIIEDMDGMIIEANEAVTVSFGWSREELLGNTLKEFIQPSCYEQVKQIFEKCRAGKKIICNIEGIWRHRYGADIATLSTFSPLTDLKGSISAIAITVKIIFSGKEKK